MTAQVIVTAVANSLCAETAPSRIADDEPSFRSVDLVRGVIANDRTDGFLRHGGGDASMLIPRSEQMLLHSAQISSVNRVLIGELHAVRSAVAMGCILTASANDGSGGGTTSVVTTVTNWTSTHLH